MTGCSAFIVFFLMLAPAGAILYAMPGELAGWAFVLAIVFAWAVMSAFDRAVRHRRADAGLFQGHRGPDARSRLGPPADRGLEAFRELKDKALGVVRRLALGGAGEQPADSPAKAC